LNPKFIVLTGPTASGKSSLLSALLYKAPQTFEIINADAFQVYRAMDIGTAKPSLQELENQAYHLINIREPSDGFSVGEFTKLAQEKILEISARGRIPLVSGGSIFYIKHLLEGLPEAPSSDEELRKTLADRLDQEGAAALYQELEKLDPLSAMRIHPNDTYRITRALEVYYSSGKALSSFKISRNSPRPEALLFTCTRSRESLNARIEGRCKTMFENGLPQEVEALFERGFNPDDPGLKAIGYKEFFVKNNEEWHFRKDNSLLEEEITIHTRQYAKRQRVFIKSFETASSLDLDSEKETLIAEKLLKRIEGFVSATV